MSLGLDSDSPLDPSRDHSPSPSSMLHLDYNFLLMASRVYYPLAQPGIFIPPRCTSLLCLENGDEVTSPWKQMLIPQLLSDVLQDDVSHCLVSFDVSVLLSWDEEEVLSLASTLFM